MRRLALLALWFTLAVEAQSKKKLSDEERIEILRGITAEYATAKVLIPRSRKALPIDSTGKYDKGIWDDAMKEFGPAARSGEQVQITKIILEDDKILLELNHGFARMIVDGSNSIRGALLSWCWDHHLLPFRTPHGLEGRQPTDIKLIRIVEVFSWL